MQWNPESPCSKMFVLVLINLRSPLSPVEWFTGDVSFRQQSIFFFFFFCEHSNYETISTHILHINYCKCLWSFPVIDKVVYLLFQFIFKLLFFLLIIVLVTNAYFFKPRTNIRDFFICMFL